MRLFIAINIPDDIRERAARFQAGLKKAGADVRWVPPANFHVTMRFIGETPEDRVPGIIGAVTAATSGYRPFVLSLQGVGAFPNPEHPHVVWIGVEEGAPGLRELAGRIDEEFITIDIPPEEREFTGHLTIGRTRSSRRRQELSRKVRSAGPEPFGSFTVGSVDIMRSELHPNGPEYTCVTSILLS